MYTWRLDSSLKTASGTLWVQNDNAMYRRHSYFF
jgi:hypothetical protein